MGYEIITISITDIYFKDCLVVFQRKCQRIAQWYKFPIIHFDLSEDDTHQWVLLYFLTSACLTLIRPYVEHSSKCYYITTHSKKE